jgi:CheY-like chemotaxis protein
MAGRVLVVDDDDAVAREITLTLEAEGLSVTRAGSVAEVLQHAGTAEQAHVVLLDLRLLGPSDVRETGFEVIGPLRSAWPETPVVVISGFLNDRSARRAFEAGASDVVSKDSTFHAQLTHKVPKLAAETEARLQRTRAHAERELARCWAEARSPSDAQRKGAALEEAMQALFATMGFPADRRSKTRQEERDLLVTNNTAHATLQKEGTCWLVECKNLKDKVGADLVHPVLGKMKHLRGRCCLAFLVSMNGFTVQVAELLRRDSGERGVVVCLTGDEVQAWIDAPERLEWLAERVKRATTA